MATYLLVLIPISLALRYLVHAPPVWVFLSGVVAIVPLADWIRRSTDAVARRAGPTIGGLLNVTFGNATELILALFVLSIGRGDVVKAQITGSIIGNGLLGLGLAVLAGSWGHKVLRFNKQRAGLLSSLLILSLIALLLPALFDMTERGLLSNPNPGPPDESLSLGVAIILIVVYLGNLVYTLYTHQDVFEMEDEEQPADRGPSLWRSLGILVAATAVIALESELVSDSLTPTAQALGLTEFFLGIIVLAVVGNAAEYLSSAYFARQNRMSIVMGITVGSTVQMALFIAPVLVIVSYLIGSPMNLVFSNPLELVAIGGVALIVNAIAHDGETTWFEGVLLLAVYILLGMAFFFLQR